MIESIYKYPRLYINVVLEEHAQISVSTAQLHYLKNVLRKNSGDAVRVFNGRDGEWLGVIDTLRKKEGSLLLTKQIKTQPNPSVPLCLFFSPLKKQRMDMLIEKSVELGVSAFYPVLMQRTGNRVINMERMHAQIIEAAEQCERLDLPVLHLMQVFCDVLSSANTPPLYICLERAEGAQPISAYSYKNGGAFLIGPEGGFSAQEKQSISTLKTVHIIHLGESILRAETAALACLSYARFSRIA